MATTRFQDTFTVGSNTALTSHTPDIGTSWTLLIDSTAGAVVVNAVATTDFATASANSSSNKIAYRADYTPASADMDVIMTLSGGGPSGGDDPIMLLARIVDASNFYALVLYQNAKSGNDFFIYKVVAGTATAIGTAASFDETGSETVMFSLRGTSLKGYKNGVELVAATDSTFTSSGMGGLGYGNIVNSIDDIALAWDVTSFQIDEIDVVTNERLPPDGVNVATNLSGATVANLDDDPDDSGTDWATASVATTATDLRVTFATPTIPPAVGAGLQEFRAQVRKTTGSPNPTLRCRLAESGSAIATLFEGLAVTATDEQVVSATWNAALLGTSSGANVECWLDSTVGSSAGSTAAFSSAGSGNANTNMASGRTVTLPATIDAGDLLIVQISIRATDAAVTVATSGWTAFPDNPYAAGNNVVKQFLYYKIADGTEDATNFTFDPDGTTADVVHLARAYRFTGASAIEGISVRQGTTGAVAAPTVTPLGTNRLGVCFVAVAENGTIGPFTGESGGDWTEATAEYVNSGGGNGSLQCQTCDLSAGTPISGGTVTPSKQQAWTAVAFALVPALTAVNTVEFGAVEWNVEQGASTVGDGMIVAVSYC